MGIGDDKHKGNGIETPLIYPSNATAVENPAWKFDWQFRIAFPGNYLAQQLEYFFRGNIPRDMEEAFPVLLINVNTWRTLDDFSSGAVCLVLASEHYDEDDYIYDYDEFLKYIGCSK